MKSHKDAVLSVLEKNHKWTVISHVKPDGDTLGSSSALVQMGLSMGKDVTWLGQDPMPERYSFLPMAYMYAQSCRFPPDRLDGLAVTLDVSSKDRGLPGMEEASDLAVIDHHGDNGCFGTFNWIDGTISSVGEMIYDLSQGLSVKLDSSMAEALYTAIVTDSGNLSFSSVTSKTVRTVADLIDLGVSPHSVAEKLYNRDSVNRLRLWALAYGRVKWESGICYSYLTHDDFLSTETDGNDTESLINNFMKVKDTEVALLFVEDGKDIKVSLRSRGNISVQKAAGCFGGGGHVCASGCRLQGPMDDVICCVMKAVHDL